MVHHLSFAATLIALATVFALLEIEIEGDGGWAARLPTWRWENRLTRWLLGARPVTGYWLYIHLFVLGLLHAPYALALIPPSAAAELRILAFWVLLWLLEDFLWFVLNPAWGLNRFRRECIPWHAEAWWWVMPREYWVFGPVGLALYLWSWRV